MVFQCRVSRIIISCQLTHTASIEIDPPSTPSTVEGGSRHLEQNRSTAPKLERADNAKSPLFVTELLQVERRHGVEDNPTSVH
jgi:hypothetical protein